MINQKVKQTTLHIVLAGLFLVPGCSPSNSSSSSEDAHSLAYESVSSVEENYVPESLDSDSSSSFLINQTVSSTQFRNFLDIQPNLLKNYLELTRGVLEGFTEVIDGVEDEAFEADSPATGTSNLDDGETLSWDVTTTTNWEISIKDSNNKKLLYADVSGSRYRMDIDGDFLIESGDGIGVFTATLNFTSEFEWDMELLMTEIPLRNNDKNTPERIKLFLEFKDALWSGKVMTYHPYAENPSGAPTMNIYTDFVANDSVAKASVYFMADSKDSVSDIADFSVGRVKENYPPFATDSFVSSHPNPVAIFPDGTATWGNNGSSKSAKVASANFLPANKWVTPQGFKALSKVQVR